MAHESLVKTCTWKSAEIYLCTLIQSIDVEAELDSSDTGFAGLETLRC